MAKYDLPELIEGYPVQYIDTATIGGISVVCKAENIEQLLGVCFEPPSGWEALSTHSLTRPAWPDYILGLGRIQLRKAC